MRKFIRYSAAAILAWAGITFAWAAVSHLTGAPGPARASAASLEFVADAVEFLDPPGVLGAPQRFAADRIRRTARSAVRIHRGPERAVARLLDRLGHDAAHRQRHRHRDHWHFSDRSERVEVDVEIPIDALDRAADRARRMAIVELERHRSEARREARRVQRDAERARRAADRVRLQVERSRRQADRIRERVELRLLDAPEAPRGGNAERSVRLAPGGEITLDLSDEARVEAMARVERLEAIVSRLDADAGEEESDFRRKLGETLREVLEELRRELEKLDVEIDAESADADGGVVRLRIRGN